jgi:hypothetical protein
VQNLRLLNAAGRLCPVDSPHCFSSGGKIDACLFGYLPDRFRAHAADLSGNFACVRIGLERLDDFSACFWRNLGSSPCPFSGGKIDACLLGYLPDRCLAYAADLSGDRDCAGVRFERRDDLCALFWGEHFRIVEIGCSKQRNRSLIDGRCESLFRQRAEFKKSAQRRKAPLHKARVQVLTPLRAKTLGTESQGA